MPPFYSSPLPDVPIPKRSIFTHVFSKNLDPNLPAYIDAATGKTLTRGDVHSQSLQLAWSLTNVFGQRTGSTVAVYSPNSLWWPSMVLGILAAGLTLTPVNSGYTPSEVARQVQGSHAHLIFVHPSLLGNTIEALRSIGVLDTEIRERIILIGFSGADAYKGVGGWTRIEQLLGNGQLDKEVAFDEAPHTTAFICYSSGTTSLPKGVELTHHNIVSQFCISDASFQYLYPNGPVMLAFLPFYHIYGLVPLMFHPLFRGAVEAIMSRFDPVEFCANIERYKVTTAFVVPPVMAMLANHPAPEKYNLRSLKILASAAAALGADLLKKAHARLDSLGVDVAVLQGYGLSETSPATNILTVEDWRSKVGSVGALLPNLQARLVGDDGQDVKEGEPGEIWIRGPTVMKGYLEKPKETQEAITPDGWFKTGDIGIVDKDGYFYIVDRKKELIKYNGYQVPPAELEDLLMTHPKVADAGVIGLWSDSRATEYPRAYIVARGGIPLQTPAQIEAFGREIQMWVQGKVARHKYLRGGVAVVGEIPKSAAGKILRRELRELAKKEVAVVGAVETKL